MREQVNHAFLQLGGAERRREHGKHPQSKLLTEPLHAGDLGPILEHHSAVKQCRREQFQNVLRAFVAIREHDHHEV